MSKYPKIAVFSTVGPCGLAMFCVVFDINWAIVRNEWLFGAFVGVVWHCRALYGVDGRSMALRDAVVRLKFNSLQEPQQPQAPSEPFCQMYFEEVFIDNVRGG